MDSHSSSKMWMSTLILSLIMCWKRTSKVIITVLALLGFDIQIVILKLHYVPVSILYCDHYQIDILKYDRKRLVILHVIIAYCLQA